MRTRNNALKSIVEKASQISMDHALRHTDKQTLASKVGKDEKHQRMGKTKNMATVLLTCIKRNQTIQIEKYMYDKSQRSSAKICYLLAGDCFATDDVQVKTLGKFAGW